MILRIHEVLSPIGICLGVWLFFVGNPPILLAQGAGAAPLSCDLASCIQTALSRHPDLQAAEARTSAAQLRVEYEMTQWRPLLRFTGRGGYIDGKAILPEEGIEGQNVSRGFVEGAVDLDVPLIREGRIWSQATPMLQQARFGLAATESLQQVRRELLIYTITEAYIVVLKTSKMVTTQEQIIKLSEEIYRMTQARFKQDLVSRNELLLAEVQLTSAKRDLTVSLNSMNLAKRGLARAMGIDGGARVEPLDTELLPLPTAPLPSLEELVSFAYAEQHRAELRSQQAQIKTQEEVVKQVKAELFPILDFNARYKVGNSFDASTNGASDQWRALVLVTVPVFDFGRNAKKVGMAMATVTEEVKKLENLKIQIAGEIQDVYAQVVDLRAQLDLLDKQIEQANEALKLTRARFQQRLLPESSVAQARIALLILQQAKAAADYDLILAYRKLEFVTGGWRRGTP